MNKDFIDNLYKSNYKKLFNYLLNKYSYKYFDLIQDSIQDSFIKALDNWQNNPPKNEFAWLYRVSENKIIDELRKSSKSINKELIEFESLDVHQEYFTSSDDSVKMVLYLMGLELSNKYKFCLTIKLLSGISNKQIADILELSEENVRKIINRSKNKLKEVININNFDENNFNSDLNLVLECIYSIFNESYFSNSSNNTISKDLAFEVLKIIELLIKSDYFDKDEKYIIYALYSLCLFHFARFDSRIQNKTLIPIFKQDRKLWDKEIINLGLYYFKMSMNSKNTTNYHIESRIIVEYIVNESFDNSNWEKIINLYNDLLLFKDNFFIKLNLIYASSQINTDIEKEISKLYPQTDIEKYYYYSFLSDFYFRANDYSLFKINSEKALDFAKNEIQKEFLKNKLNSVPN